MFDIPCIFVANLSKDNFCLVLWDPLHFISPFSCKFAGCLSTLHPSVHGQHPVEAEQVAGKLLKLAKTIIVESSTSEKMR